MIHRHLKVPDTAPPEAQPLARIVDLLQRGDLDDWRPIAQAIRREPNGQFADRVLRLLAAYPSYGTSPLWRAWIDRCRSRLEIDALPVIGGLAALRRSHGLTQVELGERMGISQSDLSKLERRRDIRLSSLRAYAAALGGGIRILFRSDATGAPLQLRSEPDAGDVVTEVTPP